LVLEFGGVCLGFGAVASWVLVT